MFEYKIKDEEKYGEIHCPARNMIYCGNINYLPTITKKTLQLHYFFSYLHLNLMKRECQGGKFW